MFVRLIEVVDSKHSYSNDISERYTVKEITINTDHISYMREDDDLSREFKNGKILKGLNNNASFTKIFLSNGSTGGIVVSVVGNQEEIEKKCVFGKKSILRG